MAGKLRIARKGRGKSGLLPGTGREERYRRLFLTEADLETELYFMKKSSDQIEEIVRDAYRLYEELSLLEIPEETKKTALKIACDVHDIKKDYIRIIQGLKKQADENQRGDPVSFSSLLGILRASTYSLPGVEESRIRLHFSCRDDFRTKEHYSLMSVLKSLVNNSVEAIQSADGEGDVWIEEEKNDDKYLLRVADNGPGIQPGMVRQVFEMGFSTKYDKSGNVARGMGLPGVRLAVEERLGGTLMVSVEPGKRTTFYIEIPAERLESRE